jgi:hypothetical protein
MFKVKNLDYASVILSVLVISVFAVFVYSNGNTDPIVKIESGGKVWIYPLDENRELRIKGPLGFTIIQIMDNNAYIVDSPCPDKLCILAGKLDKTGQWAACLPNRVFLAIEGTEDEEIDDLNY